MGCLKADLVESCSMERLSSNQINIQYVGPKAKSWNISENRLRLAILVVLSLPSANSILGVTTGSIKHFGPMEHTEIAHSWKCEESQNSTSRNPCLRFEFRPRFVD